MRTHGKVGTYVKNTDLDHTAQLSRAIVAPRYRAIRTGRYLLTKYSDGGREMYDISSDPLMLNSVWKNGRYAPVKKFLLKSAREARPLQRHALLEADRQAAEAAREAEEAEEEARHAIESAPWRGR